MRQSDDGIYELEDPNDTPEPTDGPPTVAFRIGRDVFHVRRPKLTIALGLTSLIEGGSIKPGTPQNEVAARLMETLWNLVAYVVPEDPEPWTLPDGSGNPAGGRLRGQALMMTRLRDPNDRLDILDLAEPFGVICKAMFDRPTGPSRASSSAPRDGGPGSEAGSPEPLAATSGA